MTDVPWLTDSEQSAWRGFLQMYQLLMAQLERELTHGLSHTDYQVLVNLSEAPGHQMRMSDLAAATLLSRSRLSHQIRRLTGRDLVRREECPTDRRGAFAVLTDHGWNVIQAVAPSHVLGVREHLFAHLTPDQVTALAAMSEPVVAHLRRTGVVAEFAHRWQRTDPDPVESG